MTNEDTAKQSLSSPQPKAEDEFEKSINSAIRTAEGRHNTTMSNEKVSGLLKLVKQQYQDYKSQILKEEKRKVCRHLIICNDVLEGRTCSEIQEALKQNNQRNSVGVPVSKKETENPLSGLSDEKLLEMFYIYEQALERLVTLLTPHRYEIYYRSCREIEDEIKRRTQLSKQESKETKS